MDLYYTPRSHFSRKVRILADALRVELRLVDIEQVGSRNAKDFANNPLMKVPTLVDDGGDWLIDSDHIAQFLVRRFDPGDRYGVLTTDPVHLNLRAVLNGAMSAEVELILAERSGIDTSSLPRFDKHRAVIVHSLRWLEDRSNAIEPASSYLGFHLVCLLDHLQLYGLVSTKTPRLDAIACGLRAEPFVAASAP